MNPHPARSRKHRPRSEISPPPANVVVKEQPLSPLGSAPAVGGIEPGSHSVEGPAIPGTLPILPVRNSVIFPGMVVPLPVRRPSSRKLLEESLAHSKVIGIFTQKDPSKDEPAPDDLYLVGVAATVMKLTANVMDTVPPALRDRLEVISLPGYTDNEKFEIARRYLVARQLKENGLTEGQCRFSPEALRQIISDYTREAGVRELERQVGAVCRAMAARVARGAAGEVTITPEVVQELLGPPKYLRESRLTTDKPGVVTGLAWTPIGGEILHIEALRYPGRDNILLTGQIGDVMKESAQAALSLVKSRSRELGIRQGAFKETDVHIHVPAGAVPKDGPSAGVAMFAALASLFSNTPARAGVAMTGEITLRGLILPIGGLKEKTLAAQRAGLKTVIIPKLNEKDLADVLVEVKEELKFVLAETVDELLVASLEGWSRRSENHTAGKKTVSAKARSPSHGQ